MGHFFSGILAGTAVAGTIILTPAVADAHQSVCYRRTAVPHVVSGYMYGNTYMRCEDSRDHAPWISASNRIEYFAWKRGDRYARWHLAGMPSPYSYVHRTGPKRMVEQVRNRCPRTGWLMVRTVSEQYVGRVHYTQHSPAKWIFCNRG